MVQKDISKKETRIMTLAEYAAYQHHVARHDAAEAAIDAARAKETPRTQTEDEAKREYQRQEDTYERQYGR